MPQRIRVSVDALDPEPVAQAPRRIRVSPDALDPPTNEPVNRKEIDPISFPDKNQNELLTEPARKPAPSVSAATPPPAAPPERTSTRWERANAPLWEGPTRGAKVAADWWDPTPSDGPHPVRAFVAGSMEGVGHVLSSLTSPLNLALTALTAGGSIWAKAATQGIESANLARTALTAATAAGDLEATARATAELAQATKYVDRNLALAGVSHRLGQAGAGAFVASGAERVWNGKTWVDKAMGVAEMAGGAAGVRHGQQSIGKLGTLMEESLKGAPPSQPALVKPTGERVTVPVSALDEPAVPEPAAVPPPANVSEPFPETPVTSAPVKEPPEIRKLRKNLEKQRFPQAVIDKVVAETMAGDAESVLPPAIPPDPRIADLPSLDERMAADKARRAAAAEGTKTASDDALAIESTTAIPPPPAVPVESAVPPPLAASIADRIKAEPVKRNRTTKGGGEGVPQVPYAQAGDLERLRMGQMLVAMESSEFTPKTFNEVPGQSSLGVVGGAAGHPVYYDIVGGSPEGSPPTYRYSRGEVAAKLRQFLETGKRSVVSDLALDRIRSGVDHAASDVPMDAQFAKLKTEPPLLDVQIGQRPVSAVPEGRGGQNWRRRSPATEPPPEVGQTPGPPADRVTPGQDSSPVGAPPTFEDSLRAEVAGMPDEELQSTLAILREHGAVEHGEAMLRIAEDEAARRAPADILPTGEAQPRLPGAEGVREAETPTPTFEAPFALTRETAATPPPEAPGLPLGDALSMSEDEWAADAAQREAARRSSRHGIFGNERGEAFPTGGRGGKPPTEPPVPPGDGASTPPPEAPVDLPKYAGNINLNRIDTVDGVKREILKISESHAGSIDTARRGTMTRQATRELADSLGMTVDDLLKRRRGQAFNAEEALAAREIHAASANDVYAKAESVRSARDAGQSQDAIDAAYKDLVDSLKRHVAIQTQVGGMTAEAGRALGIFNEPVTGTGDLKALRTLIEEAGGTGKLDAIAEGLVRIGPDAPKASRFVRQALKAKTLDKIYEAWLNGILSGPVTHAVNITSNAITTLMKPIETTIAAGVDTARAAVTGTPRERFLGEAGHQMFGLTEGIGKGVAAALKSFDTERPIFGATKLSEIGPGSHAIQGKLGRVVRVPTRALTAADEFFKAVIYSMEEHGLALRQAEKEGLTGKARAARIVRLMAEPTPEMQSGAAKDALYRTFNSDLVTLKGMTRLRKDVPGARWVVPFVRTPINIVSYGVERTPLSFLKIARDLGRGTLDSGQFSDNAAKAFMGTAIALGVGNAVAKGFITGNGPSDPAQRRVWLATGKLPYAFKWGDQWHQFGRLEPLGVSMGLVADFVEIVQASENDNWDTMAAKVLKSLQQNLINKTFVKGLADVLNAVSDPDQGATYLERFAGSFVPNAVATTARALDTGPRDPDGIKETLMARIPGLSQKVQPQLDITGHPLKYGDTAAERLISPIRRSAETKDPVADALVRLKIPLSAPSDRLTLPGKAALSPDDAFALEEARGQEVYARLSREIARGGFARRTPEEQVKRIQALKRAASVDVSDRARRLFKRGQPLTVEGLIIQAKRMRSAATPPPSLPGGGQ